VAQSRLDSHATVVGCPLSDTARGCTPFVEHLGCGVNRQARHAHGFDPGSLIFGPGGASSAAWPLEFRRVLSPITSVLTCMPFYTSMCQRRAINNRHERVAPFSALAFLGSKLRSVAQLEAVAPPATLVRESVRKNRVKSVVIGGRRPQHYERHAGSTIRPGGAQDRRQSQIRRFCPDGAVLAMQPSTGGTKQR